MDSDTQRRINLLRPGIEISVEIFAYLILSGPGMSKNQPSKRLSIQFNISISQESFLSTWMAPVIFPPYNCIAGEGTQ